MAKKSYLYLLIFLFRFKQVAVYVLCIYQWSTDDRQKGNGTRLNRLIINLGTEAMRNYFDSLHPPATLTATLTFIVLIYVDYDVV